MRRLCDIDYKVKYRVIDLYMARQNFMHIARFLKWLIVYRTDNYSKADLKQMKKDLSTRLQQLYEIDCLLFHSVDVPMCQDIRAPSSPLKSQKTTTDNADLAKQLTTKSTLSKSTSPVKAKFTPAEWKNEDRIAGLMHYSAGTGLMKRLKKKPMKKVVLSSTKAKVSYTVMLSESVPLIQIVP